MIKIDRAEENRGEKLYMDISSVQGAGKGSNKFWALFVNKCWRGKCSLFLKNKLDLAKEKRNSQQNSVNVIRFDNVGENKALEKELAGVM